MNNAQKFKKIWDSPILFIQNFMQITDKNGKIVPFKLNPMQKDFIKNIDSYNIILKARQGGMSVCIAGLAIYYSITTPNNVCMMLSHNDESTRAIFNKLKAIYSSLPSFIKLDLVRNNRNELQLSNGSIISCSTLGRTQKGRGNTCRLIHLSEFAFVESSVAKMQLLALEQSLQANGILVIESTANGLNGYHNLYQKSTKKENAYHSFFYNYIDTSCMFIDEYKKYNKIFLNINGHKFNTKDLTDEEIQLMKDYKDMTLDIICWRRLKIQNSSVDLFNQEFPLTPDQAFITSGDTVFDNERITNVLRALQLNKNKFMLKSEVADIPKELLKFYGKSFFMYKKPVQGKRYFIGVDSSEGVGRDYSTCIILDSEGEECGMFKNNKIKPYEFAQFINALGHYYSKAHLVVEKASGGHALLEKLRIDFRYMNMAKYKSYDQFNRIQVQVGFDTNLKTKSLIINDTQEAFDKGNILLHSIDILEEMKVFECRDNGSFGAMSGYHDDLIMALALSIVGLKSNKYYKW